MSRQVGPRNRYRGFESPPLCLGKPRIVGQDPVREAGFSRPSGEFGGRLGAESPTHPQPTVCRYRCQDSRAGGSSEEARCRECMALADLEGVCPLGRAAFVRCAEVDLSARHTVVQRLPPSRFARWSLRLPCFVRNSCSRAAALDPWLRRTGARGPSRWGA
jgi:hypothetical protein